MKNALILLMLLFAFACDPSNEPTRYNIEYQVEYLHVSGRIMTQTIHVSCYDIPKMPSDVQENDGSYWANIWASNKQVERIYGATSVLSITFVK